MSKYVQIIGDSETKVWGMTGRERLTKTLNRLDGVDIINTTSALPGDVGLLYLKGDYIYDIRLINAVIDKAGEFVLYDEDGKTPVAISTDNHEIDPFNQAERLAGHKKITIAELVSPYNKQLKKYAPARVREIRPDNKDLLERKLFSGSYKGVTDFVTKWLWPLPARLATRACVNMGLKPNHVTGLSVVLAVLAGCAFWQGQFGPGLILGWFMTFLDTVDGKLARVTLTSSRIGDVMDHGLDLVHPPLWYIAWGVGLTIHEPLFSPLSVLAALILTGYLGGRFCEGIFQMWLAPFSIFLWQPADSLTRLITARRNPNMVILTVCLFFSRPDMGLILVIMWHLSSTLFLIIRLVQAWETKQKQGELVSWLESGVPESHPNRLAVKIFT